MAGERVFIYFVIWTLRPLLTQSTVLEFDSPFLRAFQYTFNRTSRYQCGELHIYRTIHMVLSKCVLLNCKALQIKKKFFYSFFSIFHSLRKAKIVRWLFHSCTSFEAYLTNSRIFNSKVELFAFHFPCRKRKPKILELQKYYGQIDQKNSYFRNT